MEDLLGTFDGKRRPWPPRLIPEQKISGTYHFALADLGIDFPQVILESFCEDSVSLKVTALVVRAPVESVES